MTFDGAAYSGLNVRDSIATNRSNLQYLQEHLRIVDPLYGWLRPMDAIEAYRLEMASRGLFENTKELKLEDYWKPGIASCLKTTEAAAAAAAAASSTGVLVIVNLASDEYSSAVDHRTMVKIVFRHGGRTIAVHAKRARGLMVRYATLNAIEIVDDLKAFDLEGYSYQPDQSTYDDMGGAKCFLGTTITTTTANKNEEQKDTTKGKRKKRKEPPTLVFDRPATYKRPK